VTYFLVRRDRGGVKQGLVDSLLVYMEQHSSVNRLPVKALLHLFEVKGMSCP
jgi:hypothetical protein